MTKHPYDGAEGRPLLDLVIPGMPVTDRDGTHVGMVDKVEGGHLEILRTDQRTRNQHQHITPNWIVAVDDPVRLNLTIDEVKLFGLRSPMQSGISFNVPSDDCGELARARTLVGLDVMPPATERLSPIKILILPWN